MIARLRALRGLAKNIAPEVAAELEAWARENASAGVGPDGKTWPARDDGSPAHVGTSVSDTSARTSGTVAILSLKAPTVYRHFGAQGRAPRKVLPGNLPHKLGEAIRQAAIDGWEKLVSKKG